ncbi:MAG: hypothetical protein IPK19_41285 [Chloroflexi bacterium]|nr:hypothetical protein [Chloroflexota bacterium]
MKRNLIVALVVFGRSDGLSRPRRFMLRKTRPQVTQESVATLPDVPPVPEDNPMTPEKIELGKMLYFDPVSASGVISCHTCHNYRPQRLSIVCRLRWAMNSRRVAAIPR